MLGALSRDELASSFYERPMSWGVKLNFIIHDFVKNPWILNMVMAFVLIP